MKFESAAYWQARYSDGGNSGAGSFGRLAQFKAEVLNSFIKANDVKSVIEFGCGDGNQLKLAVYPKYIGLDVSKRAIETCRETFQKDYSKAFLHVANDSKALHGLAAECAISLDVIYHLIEDDVYHHYMDSLFASATRFVVVYSSNREEKCNVEHVQHRHFSSWIGAHFPAWTLTDKIPNRYPYSVDRPKGTSFADFFIYTRDGSPARVS